MGAVASRQEFRSSSTGLKDVEAWNNIFQEFGVGVNQPNISVASAQKLSVVFTCLNVLGETLGSLPCDVKQYTDKGRIVASTNPVYRLLHDRPNPFCTAFTFWSSTHKLKKAWGNAYIEIQRDNNAEPVALWIRMPWMVTPIVTGSGDLYYLYEGRMIRHTDMLHFKNYSMDGYLGISTIKQNALTIGQGLKLKEYNSKIIDDRPYGFLTSDTTRPKDSTTKSNMRKMWNSRGGEEETSTSSNPSKLITPEKISAGGTALNIPILYGGVKFVGLSLPADDVAYIESTNLTNKDIYGIFRVPPTFGQDWENTPYNGAEQQDIVFSKYTLADIRDMEQECTEKLFPESNKKAKNAFYVKFNLKAMLAGDTETRKDFYASMFQIGVLSANDIRELEDLPHYDGGDEYFVQGALVPISMIADFIQAKIDQMKSKAAAAGEDPAAAEEETKSQIRSELLAEIRKTLKKKMNGKYQEIEDFIK